MMLWFALSVVLQFWSPYFMLLFLGPCLYYTYKLGTMPCPKCGEPMGLVDLRLVRFERRAFFSSNRAKEPYPCEKCGLNLNQEIE
jgi:hypothetical protein